MEKVQNSPIYSLPVITSIENEKSLPVIVKQFNNVYGWHFEFNYDPKVIEITNCVPVAPTAPLFYAWRVREPGVMRVSCLYKPRPERTGETFKDGTKLIEIHFDKVGLGSSEIVFNDGKWEQQTLCSTIDIYADFMNDIPFERYYHNGILSDADFDPKIIERAEELKKFVSE